MAESTGCEKESVPTVEVQMFLITTSNVGHVFEGGAKGAAFNNIFPNDWVLFPIFQVKAFLLWVIALEFRRLLGPPLIIYLLD